MMNRAENVQIMRLRNTILCIVLEERSTTSKGGGKKDEKCENTKHCRKNITTYQQQTKKINFYIMQSKYIKIERISNH